MKHHQRAAGGVLHKCAASAEMSSIVNLTRHVVAACWFVGGEGRLMLRVVGKSSWRTGPSGAALWASKQRALRMVEEAHGCWPQCCYPSDVGPDKCGCDVVVMGGALTAPAGSEQRVTVAVDGRSMTDADEDVQLGALAADVPLRARHYGTMGAQWQQRRMPLPPTDYDRRFGNVAHPALQLPAAPAAGSCLAVEGMTDAPWRIEMPDAPVVVTGHYSDGHRSRMPLVVDTVLLEPAVADSECDDDGGGIMEVVARAALPIRRSGHALQRIEVSCG